MKSSTLNKVILLLVCLVAVVKCQDGLQFAQCNLTDIYTPKSLAFLGDAKSIEVGTIQFSYHEFGPWYDIHEQAREEGVPEEDLPDVPAPLILIHGFGSTQYDWPSELLESLADYRKVVVFDNPRIGFSNDTNYAPLTIEYMSNATLAFIDAIELGRPDVLGYSMGGDIALDLVARHGNQVGAVVAVAASYGGPTAPQPVAGLESVLTALENVFLAKYAPAASAPTSSEALAAPLFALDTGTDTADNSTDIPEDPYKVFFPLGSLDPAVCSMVNDYISLAYAVGLSNLPGAAYAVPSTIPSPAAIIPTPEALTQQKDALIDYHSQLSVVAALLPNVSNQILYISGIQDNVIPIKTQLDSASMTPGAWLVQLPDGGHALPFLEPQYFAYTVTDFLDRAQSLGTIPKSYYNNYATSSAVKTSVFAAIVAIAASAFAFLSMAA